MKVREYLSTLKRVVITCRPEDTVETAATLLVTNQIGAMPVTRCQRSHRRHAQRARSSCGAFHNNGAHVDRLLVGDLMAKKLITCTPDDAMVVARKVMKINRVRHLLVMEDDHLVGLLSISDVRRGQSSKIPTWRYTSCAIMRWRGAGCEDLFLRGGLRIAAMRRRPSGAPRHCSQRPQQRLAEVAAAACRFDCHDVPALRARVGQSSRQALRKISG